MTGLVPIDGEQDASTPFRMRCWGEFALAAPDGSNVTPRSRKSRALLAYLAFHPDRAIGRDRLVGMLWGDRGEEQARASLRQALLELKPLANGVGLLKVERDSVGLAAERFTSDIEELRAASDRGDAERFLVLLPDRDDRLFQDLDGVDSAFDEWLGIERAHQREHLLDLGVACIEAALTTNRLGALRALAARLHEFDPSNSAVGRLKNDLESRAGRSSPMGSPASVDGGRRRWRDAAIAGALVSALGAILIAGTFADDRIGDLPIAIAVLPFENMSGADQRYLASGVSEEIRSRLASYPRFKVRGRTSAASADDQSLDAKTLGRRLDVTYMLEGSVRSSGEQIRVDVALVRTSDGARLWSERFAGNRAETFQIQDRIGTSVAQRLARGAPSRLSATAPPTRGDVYVLYLTARDLMRDREPAKMDAAIQLLERAVKLDAGFAPAWSSLAQASHLRMGYLYERQPFTPAVGDALRATALRFADRALQLSPDLSEAHLARGGLLFNVPGRHDEARNSLERAAELDPQNAENWAALALSYDYRGDYPRALATWRRSVAADPLWWRAFYNASELAWDMGYHQESDRYSMRAVRDGAPLPFQALLVRGDMAWRRGDLSEQLAMGHAAMRASDAGNSRFASFATTRALHALGRLDAVRQSWTMYKLDEPMFEMWHGRAPSKVYVQATYANSWDGWSTPWVNSFVLRTLLANGRPAEVVRLYDRQFETPQSMLEYPGTHLDFLTATPSVGLALGDVGRLQEGSAVLATAGGSIDRRLKHGRVPNWYWFAAARVWAAGGDRERAVEGLERATRLGWVYAKRDPLPDIGDEPAFRRLRGYPRFERVRAHQNRVVARERRESARLSPT